MPAGLQRSAGGTGSAACGIRDTGDQKKKKFYRRAGRDHQPDPQSAYGGREQMVLEYEADTEETSLAEQLSRSLERDLKQKTTTAGPHRDDLSFLVNGIDIRRFGSQGQQRTAALSLKLSEIELVKKAIHDTPVLLLDDVLSELDNSRQDYLLNSIREVQTMITCTGLDELIDHRFSINRLYRVADGQVTAENQQEEL